MLDAASPASPEEIEVAANAFVKLEFRADHESWKKAAIGASSGIRMEAIKRFLTAMQQICEVFQAKPLQVAVPTKVEAVAELH